MSSVEVYKPSGLSFLMGKALVGGGLTLAAALTGIALAVGNSQADQQSSLAHLAAMSPRPCPPVERAADIAELTALLHQTVRTDTFYASICDVDVTHQSAAEGWHYDTVEFPGSRVVLRFYFDDDSVPSIEMMGKTNSRLYRSLCRDKEPFDGVCDVRMENTILYRNLIQRVAANILSRQP